MLSHNDAHYTDYETPEQQEQREQRETTNYQETLHALEAMLGTLDLD